MGAYSKNILMTLPCMGENAGLGLPAISIKKIKILLQVKNIRTNKENKN